MISTFKEKARLKNLVKHGSLNEFQNVPSEINKWSDSPYKFLTSILQGPGGTGKTELAKCLLHCMKKDIKIIWDINELVT